MIKISKKYIPWVILLIIFFLAVSLRFWNLGKVPVSLTDDETRLVYNSYSIWITAKDINEVFLPVFFLNSGYAFNPIPIYLVSPIVGIFGLNIFTARLLFALTGALSILLVYLITEKLLDNKGIALFSSLVLAFNPWHLQISRIAYEGEIALFFYLLGTLLFLHVNKKTSFLLFGSFLSFFLGFYSYSGFKITFLPVIAIIICYLFKKISHKQIATSIGLIILLFISFWYFSKTQNASSYGPYPLFFQDRQAIIKAVELERRSSPAPDILKRIYHNKFTYLFRIFITRYQYALSPEYLFVNQEASGVFSLWFRGQFYYHEAILIVFGFLYLFIKKRNEFFLLLFILFVSPLPSAVGPETVNYTLRASLMLLPLVIWIGAGIYALIYSTKWRITKYAICSGLVLVYLYFIGGYLTQYYYEWSRYGSVYYSKDVQDVITVINKEKKDSTKVIVAGFNYTLFLHYAFYNQISPSMVQVRNNQNPIHIENILFYPDCKIDENKYPLSKITYIIPEYCTKKKNDIFSLFLPEYRITDNDGNDRWLIFKKITIDKTISLHP